jgi:uncharacterized protein
MSIWACFGCMEPGQARMLDDLIRRRELSAGELDAPSATLAAFYRSAVHAAVDEGEYVARVRHSIALSARIPEWATSALPRVREACQAADEALTQHEGLLRGRVAKGRIVGGHGDLRAERVCLVEPAVVFDALEFDARLGEVDPFDELCFWGLECDIAGDASIGHCCAPASRQPWTTRPRRRCCACTSRRMP